MGHDMLNSAVGIVTAIIGLAILAVIVSRNSNSMGVIGALSGGLAQDIGAATAPVTGGGMMGGMGMMGGGFGGMGGMGGMITPSFGGY